MNICPLNYRSAGASVLQSEYYKVNQNTGKLDRDAYKIPKFSKKYLVLFTVTTRNPVETTFYL